MAKHKSKPKPEYGYHMAKVSARPPSWPGDMHVLVTCSCGRNTDFHYPQANYSAFNPLFTCQACMTGYGDIPGPGYGGGALM